VTIERDVVIEKQETTSTNDDAKQLAIEGAPHLTVVWAHRQTAGRGRQGREWTCYEGNVFWSAVLRPEPDWPRHTDLVYVNALAVHRTLAELLGPGADIKLKWPNDILLSGGKLVGSLLESGGQWTNGQPEWLVVGNGINVVDHPTTQDVRYPATSLHEAGFGHASRDPIIRALRTNLEAEIEYWRRNRFPGVRTRYLSLAHGLGTSIRVRASEDKSMYREGIYRGIDDAGSLLLEVEPGKLEKFWSGDVIPRD
jgi:BirA family biotin operon repressor/biotin-[acetyl-CoA-carboxylase] ligase